MVVHVRTASLSDTVYIPCTDTLGIVEHLVVELFLCDACQALVGLNRIFGFLLFTPQTANELLSMQHAPIVLNKEVGVAPILMQQILVALVKILSRVVVGELLFGIHLEALPLSTGFPPHIAAPFRRTRIEAVAPAMRLA